MAQQERIHLQCRRHKRLSGPIPRLGRFPEGGHGNPHPVFLPGESPKIEEPGGLLSPWVHGVRHEQLSTHRTSNFWWDLKDFLPSVQFSSVAQSCPTLCDPRFNSWVGKIPWRRKWKPTPEFLPGKSHGQRSLAGYSPWGHKGRTRLSN